MPQEISDYKSSGFQSFSSRGGRLLGVKSAYSPWAAYSKSFSYERTCATFHTRFLAHFWWDE